MERVMERVVERAPDELELQQELERFTTQLAARLTDAAAMVEQAVRVGLRKDALKQLLLYVSSAFEIATGPDPEINLLDMLVFVRSSRAVLARHWIPNRYGREGAGLVEAFEWAEPELAAVGVRAIGRARCDEVAALVDAWLADSPALVRVEGVRLADFAAAAGSAAADRAVRAKGLLSSVKTASHTANQALLLSERTLFLAHRLPFLWRLQARVGALELLSDVSAELSRGPSAPLARMRREAGRLARRGLVYLGLLGAAGILARQLTSRTRG